MAAPADKRLVGQQAPVWTFTRGSDRLQISREPVDEGTMLIVAGDGAPRSYFFRELPRLETFQRDMETLLLKTGWGFAGFTPEKRRGRDRRGWPRKNDDRRRWWTDGAPEPKPKPARNAMRAALQVEPTPLTPSGTDPAKPRS